MSKSNNTVKRNNIQYHHLKYEDRCKIEILISQKDNKGKRLFNNTYIAKQLGVSKSTISRELRKRIKSKIFVLTSRFKNKPYNATDAHDDYLFKRGLSKGEYVLNKFSLLAKFIEDKIKKDKWSPDVIVGWMNRHKYYSKQGFTSISTPTIYNAIRYGIINVNLNDTRRMKYKPEYKYKEISNVSLSKLPYSITNRPDEINKREVFRHFELDTVLSKKTGKDDYLLTITERKTRFEMIFRLPAKSSSEVTNKINQLKIFLDKHYDKIFKSYTTDNGSEFSNFIEIMNNSKTDFYFCHPYCSGEKGTNEKHNSMIRYFIPKGSLIENISNNEINKIASWMNNYPRKILNYKTPLECILEEFNNKSIINKIYNIQEYLNCV